MRRISRSLLRLRVNALLQKDRIRKEFHETRRKAIRSRGSEREEVLKRPPRLRFVSEYHTAVYDQGTGIMHEGRWSDLHSSIIRVNRVAAPKSCSVFCLRATRGTRVAILDTLDGVSTSDLVTIRNLEYEVMGPKYHWIIESKQGDRKFVKTPSSLSSSTLT